MLRPHLLGKVMFFSTRAVPGLLKLFKKDGNLISHGTCTRVSRLVMIRNHEKITLSTTVK
jgi:hypothetical protein